MKDPQHPKLVGLDCIDSSHIYVIGCDPGYSGAIAVVDVTNQEAMSVVAMVDMPTIQKDPSTTKSKMRKRVDAHAVAFALAPYARYVSIALLEDPGSRPNQGLESTYRFGEGCGVAHGVMAALLLPVFPIKPSVWKLALGLNSDKRSSLDLANATFPEQSWLFKRKKDNDRAEAALMALFAAKHLKKEILLSKIG